MMNVGDLMNWVSFETPRGGNWCSVHKAQHLAALVVGLRPPLVVEIGVWMGGSLVPLALAAREVGGRVVGIDPWHGGASAAGQQGANLDWWQKVDHEGAYQHLVARLSELALDEVVSIWRVKSDDVDPPPDIGLLHVDGNHGEQAERDIHRYAPQVTPGGVVVLDDVHWEGGGVARGAVWMTGNGFRRLYDLDTGAVFQRVA